ncbi:hypothetical protein P3T18_004817 [Paraburkholderia sp. GAS199]
MARLQLVSFFVGGAILANAVPQPVSGVLGGHRPVQSGSLRRGIA